MTVPNVQVRQQCEFALIHCQNTMTMYQRKFPMLCTLILVAYKKLHR